MSYKVEYWENEEAREYGLGEIYDSEIKSKTKAIAIADMLYDNGCAAVEVINEQNDKVVYGNYDEDNDATADELAERRYLRGEYTYDDYCYVCFLEECEPLTKYELKSKYKGE